MQSPSRSPQKTSLPAFSRGRNRPSIHYINSIDFQRDQQKNANQQIKQISSTLQSQGRQEQYSPSPDLETADQDSQAYQVSYYGKPHKNMVLDSPSSRQAISIIQQQEQFPQNLQRRVTQARRGPIPSDDMVTSPFSAHTKKNQEHYVTQYKKMMQQSPQANHPQKRMHAAYLPDATKRGVFMMNNDSNPSFDQVQPTPSIDRMMVPGRSKRTLPQQPSSKKQYEQGVKVSGQGTFRYTSTQKMRGGKMSPLKNNLYFNPGATSSGFASPPAQQTPTNFGKTPQSHFQTNEQELNERLPKFRTQKRASPSISQSSSTSSIRRAQKLGCGLKSSNRRRGGQIHECSPECSHMNIERGMSFAAMQPPQVARLPNILPNSGKNNSQKIDQKEEEYFEDRNGNMQSYREHQPDDTRSGSRLTNSRLELMRYTLEGNRPTPHQSSPSGQLLRNSKEATSINKLRTSVDFFPQDQHKQRGGLPEIDRVDKNSLELSKEFSSHENQQIRRVQQDWDPTQIEDQKFWEARKQSKDKDREMLKSTQIKSVTQNVLEQQTEVFKKLKVSRERLTSKETERNPVVDLFSSNDPNSPRSIVVSQPDNTPNHKDDSDEEFIPGYGGTDQSDPKIIDTGKVKVIMDATSFPSLLSKNIANKNDGESRSRYDTAERGDQDFAEQVVKVQMNNKMMNSNSGLNGPPPAKATNYEDFLARKCSDNQLGQNKQIEPHSQGDFNRTHGPTAWKQSDEKLDVANLMFGGKGQPTFTSNRLSLANHTSEGRVDYQVGQIKYDQSNDGISGKAAQQPKEVVLPQIKQQQQSSFHTPKSSVSKRQSMQPLNPEKATQDSIKSQRRETVEDLKNKIQNDEKALKSSQRQKYITQRLHSNDAVPHEPKVPSFKDSKNANSPTRMIQDSQLSERRMSDQHSLMQLRKKSTTTSQVKRLHSKIEVTEAQRTIDSNPISQQMAVTSPDFFQMKTAQQYVQEYRELSQRKLSQTISKYSQDLLQQYKTSSSPQRQGSIGTSSQGSGRLKVNLTRLHEVETFASKMKQTAKITFETKRKSIPHIVKKRVRVENDQLIEDDQEEEEWRRYEEEQARLMEQARLQEEERLAEQQRLMQEQERAARVREQLLREQQQRMLHEQQTAATLREQAIRDENDRKIQEAKQEQKRLIQQARLQEQLRLEKLREEEDARKEKERLQEEARRLSQKQEDDKKRERAQLQELARQEMYHMQQVARAELKLEENNRLEKVRQEEEAERERLRLGEEARLQRVRQAEEARRQEEHRLQQEHIASLQNKLMHERRLSLQPEEVLSHLKEPKLPKCHSVELDYQFDLAWDDQTVDKLALEFQAEECQVDLPFSSDGDDDGHYETSQGAKSNQRNCAIQTSKIHFLNLAELQSNILLAKEKAYSTDWQHSSLFDELQFKKGKKSQALLEDCGQQVDEKQIEQETQIQILSQIECEYNAEMLRHKQVTGAQIETERTFELYVLGLQTLQALMYMLRLQKEWETVTKPQYELDLDFEGVKTLNAQVDNDQCIKLLVRCHKMYEAKSQITRLLKMVVDKDRQVELLNSEWCVNDKSKAALLVKLKRLSGRITQQISALQEEHRILRRPFILRGGDYLQVIDTEMQVLQQQLGDKYFVDDTGTAGDSYTNK